MSVTLNESLMLGETMPNGCKENACVCVLARGWFLVV